MSTLVSPKLSAATFSIFKVNTKKDIIKDICGQNKDSLYDYGLIGPTDDPDFTAKLLSLNSKWESHCTRFFDSFLR